MPSNAGGAEFRHGRLEFKTSVLWGS